MDTIEIIKLEPEEWQGYRILRLEALQNDPQAFGSSYQEYVRKPDSYWQGRLEDAAEGKKDWLLFAKENDRLIGMVGAFIKDEEDVAEIISLYVTKDARGKGVSKLLMSGLLHELEHNTPVVKVKLSVNIEQLAAVRLYESFGFVVAGQENARLGDGKIHEEYIMERVIKSPSNS